MKKLILMLLCLSVVGISQEIQPIRIWKSKRSEYRIDRVAVPVNNTTMYKELILYNFPGWKYKSHVIIRTFLDEGDRVILMGMKPKRPCKYYLIEFLLYRPLRKR